MPGDMKMESNGYSNRRTLRVILAGLDCLLIVLGVFASEFLIFGETGRYYSINEISVWRIIAFVMAIQIPLYYFELYRLIYLREKKRMPLRLLGSMALSFLLLAILSYSVPYLSIRRAVAAVTIAVVFNDSPYDVIIRGAEKKMRPHYDGVPRQEGCRRTPDWQRNTKSINPYQDSSAGVPLNVGAAR